jgi:type I restriction enzyme S subunit
MMIMLTTVPIPVAPAKEQHRIVARFDELMARCDALEKLRAERDAKRSAVHTAELRSPQARASTPQSDASPPTATACAPSP